MGVWVRANRGFDFLFYFIFFFKKRERYGYWGIRVGYTDIFLIPDTRKLLLGWSLNKTKNPSEVTDRG